MTPSHKKANRSLKNQSKSKASQNNNANNGSIWSKIKAAFYEYVNIEFGKNVLLEPEYTGVVAGFLLIAEVVLNSFIILNRSYTEIDWKAYMQEVEGFINGTLDYQLLKGDTGPLVYPAGFVHIFALFYFATSHGTNIKLAQWIFGFLYVVLMCQVFRIYNHSRKVPPYALLFLTFTSYRIHSIFVLRLFNDPIAMILTYTAINSFLNGRWTLGSLSYSLAVAVKMNVLLFAPALLAIFLTQLTLFDTIVQLAVCGVLQVVLALPFLIVNPWSYISRSFDLGRVFLYEWTVNWKFLPEEYFLNRWFHLGLLLTHLIVLALFLKPWLRYLQSYYNLKKYAESSEGTVALQIRSQLMLYPLFVSNFVGICFSRSLHYQFYVWYYHTIPYLLWSTKMPTQMKLVIFGLIELCWNVFPATPWSSLTLTVCHLCLLIGLFHYTVQKDWNIKLKNR